MGIIPNAVVQITLCTHLMSTGYSNSNSKIFAHNSHLAVFKILDFESSANVKWAYNAVRTTTVTVGIATWSAK